MNNMKDYLKNLTEEQRKEMREKAAITRAEKQKWAEDNLKTDWLEDNYWCDLAKKHGIRLPQKHIPNTEMKYLKRVLKKCNVDYKEYLEACGCKSFTQLAAFNPTATIRAEVGWALEFIEDQDK